MASVSMQKQELKVFQNQGSQAMVLKKNWSRRRGERSYSSRSLPFSDLMWTVGVDPSHWLRGGKGALTDRGDSVTEDDGVCRWRRGRLGGMGDSGSGSMPNCSGLRKGEGGTVCEDDARRCWSSGGGYVGVVGILSGGQSGVLSCELLCRSGYRGCHGERAGPV